MFPINSFYYQASTSTKYLIVSFEETKDGTLTKYFVLDSNDKKISNLKKEYITLYLKDISIVGCENDRDKYFFLITNDCKLDNICMDYSDMDMDMAMLNIFCNDFKNKKINELNVFSELSKVVFDEEGFVDKDKIERIKRLGINVNVKIKNLREIESGILITNDLSVSFKKRRGN